MSEKKIDLLAIGNPIVDVLVKTEDDFLKGLGLKRGGMNIIERKVADKIFKMFSEINKNTSDKIIEMSGGCAANVAAGISSFNCKASFIGKLGHDKYGNRFIKKLKEREVETENSIRVHGGDTGRSFIIVTPCGGRTMCTYPGSAFNLDKTEVKEEHVAMAKTVFISAYMLDGNDGKETLNSTIKYAKRNDCKIALALADFACVQRHRKDLIDIVENQADIVFANKDEINTLLESSSHDDSIKIMSEKYEGKDKIAALTCSSDGAVIINKEGKTAIKAEKVDNIIDSTGSGALFASGFLFGLMKGLDIEKSARLGNMAAAECISHLGARPRTPLVNLLTKI
jgi:sugar/nucleoside kinase (ribokinase family)